MNSCKITATDCSCGPCDCDLPISAGDSCVCGPPCDCDPVKSKDCSCNPCACETPPVASPKNPPATPLEGLCDPSSSFGRGFTLNEFIRAKEYFLTASTSTGLNLYDHVAELLRTVLDNRAPGNPCDFLEEISLNLKRYRFGMRKDLVRETHFLSPSAVATAATTLDTWTKHSQWSKFQSENMGEGDTYGGFPNLIRLLYYLEQINVGLPREEMFNIALSLRQLNVTHPIKRSRFWGKIFGIKKDYYVVEAELNGTNDEDLWNASEIEGEADVEQKLVEEGNPFSVPSGADTFERAKSAVTDPEILIPYQETSGVPPSALNTIAAPTTGIIGEVAGEGEGSTDPLEAKVDPQVTQESSLWTTYQKELMEGFPAPVKIPEDAQIVAETTGTGINRRAFYVTNDLKDKWLLLPNVSPKQIQVSRRARRFLSGDLDAKLDVYPEFDGREAHYLKSMVARITAGSQVSPKGCFRRTKPLEDDDEEELEEEEEEEEQAEFDAVYPVKKFRPERIDELLAQPPELWVHHVSNILKQGRTTWWNPNPNRSFQEEEMGEDEEEENDSGKEYGPPLMSSLANDSSPEGYLPWSPRASSTLFHEFQMVSMRSNIWPGATAFCTSKGKVENIYFGDGLKFRGTCFAPPVPVNIQSEYKQGPELKELTDPTFKQEQDWLNKLELDALRDVEDKFVDNEIEESETEVEEEEEEEEDVTEDEEN